MVDKESLVMSLHEIGAVQFGEFTLKSGESSPIYLDLRLLVSRPRTLRRVAHTLQAIVAPLEFDRLAAVPLAALPIGVALSLAMDRPLIYPRPETKKHGTRREIEGECKAGETALLIDDVLSRGHSKLEVIAILKAAGLNVTDLLVVVDRQMGGVEELTARGYHVHSALTMREILDILKRRRKITQKQHDEIVQWLSGTHQAARDAS